MAPSAVSPLPNQTVPRSPDLKFDGSFVHIIGGKSSPTKQTRHGLNPANLQPMGDVPLATHDDVDNAVSTARKAFTTWSQVPYEDRRMAVLAYADAVDQFRLQFRDLLISEQGKPVCQAKFHYSKCR